MIIFRADLVAGIEHAKWHAGTVMPAVLFVYANTPDEARAMAASELSELGWSRLEITTTKIVAAEGMNNASPEIQQCFEEAALLGFSHIIYPEPWHERKSL